MKDSWLFQTVAVWNCSHTPVADLKREEERKNRLRATMEEKAHFIQWRSLKPVHFSQAGVPGYFGYWFYAANTIKWVNNAMTLFNNLSSEILTNEEKLIKTEFCCKFKTCTTLCYHCIVLLYFKKDQWKKINFTPKFLELGYMLYRPYFYEHTADRKCWTLKISN